MSAVSLAIVDRADIPIYCHEFPSKYHWKEEGIATEEDLFGVSLSDGDGAVLEKSTSDFRCSLKQQFMLQTALDRFVQLAGPPPGFGWRSPGVTNPTDAMFVGLLCSVEDFRVYGYAMTTKMKIVVVVEDDELVALSDQQSVDDRIKALMVRSCWGFRLMSKRWNNMTS